MSNQQKTVATRGRPKTTRTQRPDRIPMSGSRKRMHIDIEDQDPAFHYAWINDSRDLIHRAKRAGFENVTVEEMPQWGTPDVDSADSTSSLVCMKVNADTTAYLMKQPIEYYEEDRKAMDNLVDSREADMKKNLNSGQEGTYGKVDIS